MLQAEFILTFFNKKEIWIALYCKVLYPDETVK